MSVEAAQQQTQLVFRPPSTSNTPAPPAYTSPTLPFLQTTWYVTHSTLPMWKTKRNVRITYTLLPPSDPSIAADQTDRLDDLVEYQGLDSDKQHTVHGVDKASGGAGKHDVWDWRGKGWLMIASSHWEVLGWGEEQSEAGEGEPGNKWAVTFFAKTLFTPAGIDVYSSGVQGVRHETLAGIKAALADMDSAEVRSLAAEIFEIKTDR